MAKEETTAGGPTSAAQTRDWEHRNTDPTVPFDGALPENIPGPASNVQLQVAADKRSAAHGNLSTRLRPEHADQELKSGDAITDSDVNAAPSKDLKVGDDNGEAERAKQQAEAGVTGEDGKPVGRASRSERQTRA